MFSPFVKEVKLMGQGGLPGWNPSGSPAYMYQATVQPAPSAPSPQPASPPAVTTPVSIPGVVPVAPVVPATTVVVTETPGISNTGLVLMGIVGLAFLGALLLPTGERRR